MLSVDLNCDMGEGFGPWPMGNDAELMKFVSSANIACGFHAGDPATMRKTVEVAVKRGVAIGAHPGFPDLQGFGRRAMSLRPQEIYDLVLYQVAALKGICEANGTKLRHVKPHGALYNQAAADAAMAGAIANAVAKLDPNLIVYGLSGSFLISAAKTAGLRAASEVFADRTYQENGSLTPRTDPNALVADPAEAARQALQMVAEKIVISTSGKAVNLNAETICIHGDSEHAVEFASAIRAELDKRGVAVIPPFP